MPNGDGFNTKVHSRLHNTFEKKHSSTNECFERILNSSFRRKRCLFSGKLKFLLYANLFHNNHESLINFGYYSNSQKDFISSNHLSTSLNVNTTADKVLKFIKIEHKMTKSMKTTSQKMKKELNDVMQKFKITVISFLICIKF